jgi:hypothetical protein
MVSAEPQRPCPGGRKAVLALPDGASLLDVVLAVRAMKHITAL